jgi:hypothetical protein
MLFKSLFLLAIAIFPFSQCAWLQESPKNRQVEMEPQFVHSREFEKIAENNFIGKWQGQTMDLNSQIIQIDLEVQRSEEEEFLIQLSVPSSQILLYRTKYLMGRNVLEGEGITMEPIMGGFAEIQVKNHPNLPNSHRLKVSLVNN